MRLFDALRRLRELAAMLNLDWSLLLSAITQLATLWPFPDPSDEAACREWLRKCCRVGGSIADLTGTGIDDAAWDAFGGVIDNEAVWAMAWALWTRLVAGDAPPLAEAKSDLAETEKAGIDPATILAIIMAAVEFLKWWREHRPR